MPKIIIMTKFDIVVDRFIIPFEDNENIVWWLEHNLREIGCAIEDAAQIEIDGSNFVDRFASHLKEDDHG